MAKIVKEKSGNLRKMRKVRAISGKHQGILTYSPNVRILPFLRFNVMTTVSTKMPYQGVRKISVRLGKSQGKVKEDES